jgi:cob(I)alamin adenosyltransferase
MEHSIDKITGELPQLKNFILPGGGELASRFHILRTVCRRAERAVVCVLNADSLDPLVVIYLNRLSDYFFTVARYCSFMEKEKEVLWKG